MGRGKKKRPRNGCERENDETERKYYDLMVAIPALNKQGSNTEREIKIRQTLKRLESLGYDGAALTHTIYGRPNGVSVSDIFEPFEVGSSLTVYRRLHCVIENTYDVAFFSSVQESTTTTTTDFDLISLAPRNDVTFQAACATARYADIITIDYSAGRLPFRIRPTDLQAAISLNLTFEICYEPSIINPNLRKFLVQAARVLQLASKGRNLRLILTSGAGNNFMAVRSPDDMRNILENVLLFDSNISRTAMTKACDTVLQRGRGRMIGDFSSDQIPSGVVGLFVQDNGLDSVMKKQKGDSKPDKPQQHLMPLSQKHQTPSGKSVKQKLPSTGMYQEDNVDEGGEDGFIAL